MEKRVKMSRTERAKQFAPFDALKGLQNALRLKEYEHERVMKGDLSNEQIEGISKVILNLKPHQTVELTYFVDGYYKNITGRVKAEIENQILQFEDNGLSIKFEDIFNIIPK